MPRWLPAALMGTGAILVVVSIIGFATAGSSSPEAAPPTSQPSTTLGTTTTTTQSPTTSSSTTSTDEPTATSTTSPSTTSTVADESVEEFVSQFAAALEAGDVAFVTSRLHPDVSDAFGVDLCSTWIEREIMALRNYTLVSIDGGPVAKSLNFPGGERIIPDLYDATVSFTFQGQDFTTPTDYALVGSLMHWLGACQ